MTEEPIDGSIGGAEFTPDPEPVTPEPEPVEIDHEMIEEPGRPMAGWLLIAVGAMLLVGNIFHLSGGLFLIALGGAFLAGYFSNRRYGLLIPAMILIFLGIGVVIEESRALHLYGFEVPLLLGMGFCAIWLVDRFTWNQSSTWPLWPGGILVIIALWGMAVEADLFHDIWWDMMDILGTWWPALLIIWGFFLLRKRGGKTGVG